MKHGQARRSGHSPTHVAWANMRQRCLNPSNPSYADYGARGITICARWQNFSEFFADMGAVPNGLTLERIDNDRGYEPSNCRWATRSDQARNRRFGKLNALRAQEIVQRLKNGERVMDLAAEFKVHRVTIYKAERIWIKTRSNSIALEG